MKQEVGNPLRASRGTVTNILAVVCKIRYNVLIYIHAVLHMKQMYDMTCNIR